VQRLVFIEGELSPKSTQRGRPCTLSCISPRPPLTASQFSPQLEAVYTHHTVDIPSNSNQHTFFGRSAEGWADWDTKARSDPRTSFTLHSLIFSPQLHTRRG